MWKPKADTWAKETTRLWPWKAVQMLFLPQIVCPSLKIASFLLQTDFLGSLIHVSRAPQSTCCYSYLSPKKMAILSNSREGTLFSPAWPDFYRTLSSGQRTWPRRADGCRLPALTRGVRSGGARDVGQQPSRCALQLAAGLLG